MEAICASYKAAFGEFFNPDSYELPAKAQTDDGWVIVVNNSSRILVASVVEESMTDGETTGNARLETAFPYTTDWPRAYDAALEAMRQLVATHTTVEGARR